MADGPCTLAESPGTVSLESDSMPNCFQLTNKETGLVTSLQAVDIELCKHLDLPVHKTYYVGNWYNTIGFTIATHDKCGLGTQLLRDKLKEIYGDATNFPIIEKCLAYLEAHYTSDAWVEIGRR